MGFLEKVEKSAFEASFSRILILRKQIFFSALFVFLYFYQMKLISLLLLTIISFTASAQENPGFYVKTNDSLPYLNYGLGRDRLGGAKMGFLDSNIVLLVVDSLHSQYEVQLSKQHSAWIEKNKVVPIVGMNVSHNLSGSWKVWGDSLFDYVAISLPQKLPYRSQMEIDPARIVVDLYGVTSNTNWITQLKTVKEIKNVWYDQVENDMMRVFIELKHPQHWGYHIFYDSLQRLTIRVNRQPKLQLKGLKIAVDAGHGGDQSGAEGIETKILEKDYTLLFAKELQKQLLKKGAKVVMTREKDTTLGMPERLGFLQKEQPDLLISIHFNSSSIDTTEGVSTYYRYIGFRPLSTQILDKMLMLGLNNFGNVGSFNFALSGPTEFPNCLVEVAFLSNVDDERKIRSEVFKKKVAAQIVAGIESFLKTRKP